MLAKPNFPTFIGNSPAIDTINLTLPLRPCASALWCCPNLQLPQFCLQTDFSNIRLDFFEDFHRSMRTCQDPECLQSQTFRPLLAIASQLTLLIRLCHSEQDGVPPSALWCCPTLQLPLFSLQTDFFNIRLDFFTDFQCSMRTCQDPECLQSCLLYTSPSPRDGLLSRMPSSA